MKTLLDICKELNPKAKVRNPQRPERRERPARVYTKEELKAIQERLWRLELEFVPDYYYRERDIYDHQRWLSQEITHARKVLHENNY